MKGWVKYGLKTGYQTDIKYLVLSAWCSTGQIWLNLLYFNSRIYRIHIVTLILMASFGFKPFAFVAK